MSFTSLQASPRLRFNKEGSLLAVTTSDNGIKILANNDGRRLLRMLEGRSFEGSRSLAEAVNIKVFLLLQFIFSMFIMETDAGKN